MITMTVKIEIENKHAVIICSNCLLERHYDEGIGTLTEPVDVYGMLVDDVAKETS